MNQSIFYISFGIKSNIQLIKSIQSLYSLSINTKADINVISNDNLNRSLDIRTKHIKVDTIENDLISSRYYKTQLNQYQNEYNIYLDSDTIVLDYSIMNIYKLLDNFDLVICPSSNQGIDSLWHLSDNDRNYTLDTIGYSAVQLQCGVFAWRRCELVDKLFKAWYDEWNIYKQQDQGAFIRAIHKVPVRYYLLGKPYNSSMGSIVTHNFGKIR